jgi:hypothetical protein
VSPAEGQKDPPKKASPKVPMIDEPDGDAPAQLAGQVVHSDRKDEKVVVAEA